jgi:hypothetical protein
MLTPAVSAVAYGLGWAFAQAARPILWLVDQLGIDPERVREFLDQLRQNVFGDGNGQIAPGEPAIWQRALAVVLFLAIAYGIFWLIRRWRPKLSVEPRARRRADVRTESLREDAVEGPRTRLRRELPADAVRRWYAEALLVLRDRDVRKEPALTPAEFVPQVAAACPAGVEDFRALTRAYEDVRYGNLRLGSDAIRALEHAQRRLLAALREPPAVSSSVTSSG